MRTLTQGSQSEEGHSAGRHGPQATFASQKCKQCKDCSSEPLGCVDTGWPIAPYPCGTQKDCSFESLCPWKCGGKQEASLSWASFCQGLLGLWGLVWSIKFSSFPDRKHWDLTRYHVSAFLAARSATCIPSHVAVLVALSIDCFYTLLEDEKQDSFKGPGKARKCLTSIDFKVFPTCRITSVSKYQLKFSNHGKDETGVRHKEMAWTLSSKYGLNIQISQSLAYKQWLKSEACKVQRKKKKRI